MVASEGAVLGARSRLPALHSSCSRLALSTPGELREWSPYVVLMIWVPRPEGVPCHKAHPSTQTGPLSVGDTRTQAGRPSPAQPPSNTCCQPLRASATLAAGTYRSPDLAWPRASAPPPAQGLQALSQALLILSRCPTPAPSAQCVCLLPKTSPCSPSLFLSRPPPFPRPACLIHHTSLSPICPAATVLSCPPPPPRSVTSLPPPALPPRCPHSVP